MTLRVVLQMDDVEGADARRDTSIALAVEAQDRGHEVLHCASDAPYLRDGRPGVDARALRITDAIGARRTLGDVEAVDLCDVDVVLMRRDPPFDEGYLATTHVLERVGPGTLVVNDPVAVRDAPEKILPTDFEGLSPPTVVTRNRRALNDFRSDIGDVVVKPAYGAGGVGVFVIRRNDENFGSVLDMLLTGRPGPIVMQRYLPDVRFGDKRVLLVEGEAVAALNRVPADGEARANIHAGGTAVPADVTDRDRHIAAVIGPRLVKAGIVLAGIDVIGGLLTEINVTSPTCAREIKDFGGPDVAAAVWDAIEARVRRRRGDRPNGR